MTETEHCHNRLRWIEPWFLSYALLGASAAGIVPILLPLSIVKTGSISEAGLVIGVFNLGGLTAPVWGGIADRHGLHSVFFLIGLVVSAAGFAFFPFTSSLGARIVLALVQGAGVASVATVANLFIVEVHPRREWDERIGWLQTFYGGGQAAGLLLAGLVSDFDPHTGFLVAAGLTLIAILPGRQLKEKGRAAVLARPFLRHPARHTGLNAGSPQAFYHHIAMNAARSFLQSFKSGFGMFLAGWVLSFAGAAAFFSLFPVVMKQLYGVNPSLSSVGFSVAATIGLFLYAPAGRWSANLGALRVFQAALTARVLAFLLLVVLAAGALLLKGPFALAGFTVVVGAWSLLSVTGTAITAQFCVQHEGEGLGVFNAATAVAGVLGAIAGGWCADQWGYCSVPVLGVVGGLTGLLGSLLGLKETKKSKGRVS